MALPKHGESITLAQFRKTTNNLSTSREIVCQDDQGRIYSIDTEDFETSNGQLVLFIRLTRDDRSR